MFQIAKADSEEEKKRLQEEFNDKEKKARRRSSGNTRFIGELYKLEMSTVSFPPSQTVFFPSVMNKC